MLPAGILKGYTGAKAIPPVSHCTAFFFFLNPHISMEMEVFHRGAR